MLKKLTSANVYIGAKPIVDALARALPGYLVPRLVREVPGGEAKVVLAAGLDTA